MKPQDLVTLSKKRKTDSERSAKVSAKIHADKSAKVSKEHDEEAAVAITHKKRAMIFTWGWHAAGHPRVTKYESVDKFVEVMGGSTDDKFSCFATPCLIDKAIDMTSRYHFYALNIVVGHWGPAEVNFRVILRGFLYNTCVEIP